MPNEQLLNYIDQARKSGKTDDQIRKELLSSGWSVKDIEETIGGSRPTSLFPQAGLSEIKGHRFYFSSPKKLYKILTAFIIVVICIIGSYYALANYFPQYAKYVQPYLGPVLDRIVGNNFGYEENKNIEIATVKTEPPKFGENLIEICHHASGNLANWHEINVASPSVTLTGHLNHGDTIGKCQSLTIPTATPTSKILHPSLGKIISCNKNPVISNVDDRKVEDIKCLKDAIIKYYEDNDRYPVSFELDKSLGPYFPDGVPKDPVSSRNYYYAYMADRTKPKAFQVWAELEKYHPALEYDSDFNSLNARGWLGNILWKDESEKCVNPNPKGPDPLKEDLSKGTMIPDCVYDLKFDGYIPTSSDPVCAVYFGAGDPITYIKGPWTDNRQFTNSKEKCRQYIEDNVLNQVHCGQSYPPLFMVLLLLSAKTHSYVMPTYGEVEYVFNGFCPSSIPTHY